MKNQELYNRTVSILVKAYLEDTLVHNYCNACAVGNIIAGNKGYKVNIPGPFRTASWSLNNETIWPAWDDVFITAYNKGQEISPNAYEGEAKEQIDSTGYKWRQLAKIEYAFESAPQGANEDEWMFNGLMAVIDVLDIIHENTDKSITETTKQLFVKA